MTALELCPACQRLAHDLVELALDFTALVSHGGSPRLCEQHLPLVFSCLGYRTMAVWLDRMLELRESDPAAFHAKRCPLCETEARFKVNDEEATSAFLCSSHGGSGEETLALIRTYLARIANGERFDGQRFVIRAALLFYASVRGAPAFVRIE